MMKIFSTFSNGGISLLQNRLVTFVYVHVTQVKLVFLILFSMVHTIVMSSGAVERRSTSSNNF